MDVFTLCALREGESPTTNGGMQNGSSVGTCVHVAYAFFAHFAPISCARSVLINTISASELRRKFSKSELLVGRERKHIFSLFSERKNRSGKLKRVSVLCLQGCRKFESHVKEYEKRPVLRGADIFSHWFT